MIFKSKKTRKLEALILLKESFQELAVYKAQPQQYIAMQNRLNRRLERIADKIVNRAFDPELYDYHEWDEQIKALWAEQMSSVASLGIQEIIENPRIALTFDDVWGKRLDTIMEDRTFNASERTINRMTGDVLDKIKEGIREGRGLAKTDNELKTVLQDMTKGELRRISATETHSVYMQSKHEAIQTGNAPYKKWKHVYDGPLPRDWHEDMDEEVVPKDEPFSNGLMFPGDPDGGPEEIINCYCDLVPEWEMEGGDLKGDPIDGSDFPEDSVFNAFEGTGIEDVPNMSKEEFTEEYGMSFHTVEEIPIDQLEGREFYSDGGTNVEPAKQGYVTEYAESMKRGDEFPPIDVYSPRPGRDEAYQIFDGHRRTLAAEEAGLRTIKADVTYYNKDNQLLTYDKILEELKYKR